MLSLVLIIALGGLTVVGHIPLIDYWPYSFNPLQTATSVILFVVFGLPALFGIILFFCSLIALNANMEWASFMMPPLMIQCSIFIGMYGLSIWVILL